MSQQQRPQRVRFARLSQVVDPRALAYFSILFVMTICAMYCALFFSGKTLIREIDGLDQHYPFFLYIGKWIRASLLDLISGRGLPQVWNLNFGYGADMLTTLGAYLPDPFNWLSALVPPAFSEAGFVGTVILRLWCSGVTFLVYCRRKRFDTAASVVAALLYATCGVTVIAPVQTFFVNPMITFPLVVMGMSKVMDGERPTLFICSLAATFAVYFYFGYMTCILLVPAFVGEVLSRGWGLLEAVRRFAAFVGYSLVAIALSAVVLLPIVLVVAQTDRLGLVRPLPVLYDLDYYKRLLGGFTSWAYVGPDSHFGVGAVGAFFVMMLAVSRRHVSEKVTLAVYTLFLLVPLFGKVLNGFAYVANRWTWAYAFVVASVVASFMPSSFELGTVRRRVLYCLCGAYLLVLLYLSVPGRGGLLYLLPLLAFAAVVLCHALLPGDLQGKVRHAAWCGACCVAVVAGSAIAASSLFANSAVPQLDAGTALFSVVHWSPYQVLERAVPEDEGTHDWRVENLVPGSMSQALVNEVNSYDHYISIYNNRVDRLHTLLGLNGTQQNVRYRDLDARLGLEYAFGTRYVLTNTSRPYATITGYDEVATEDDVRVLRTDVFRPIASLCDQTVSVEDFEAASMVEREAMLTSSVVTKDGGAGTASVAQAKGDVSEVGYRVAGASGVQADGSTFTVAEENAYVDLAFSAEEGRLYYLELTGSEHEPIAGDASMSFLNGDGEQIASLYLLSPLYHMSGGKVDWVVNLGRFAAGEQVVRVTFSSPGTYGFKGMRLVSMSASIASDANVRRLASGDKVSTRFGNNEIACDVSASKDETLLVTTPWSAGWQATIDGAPAEVVQADVAFMGVRVPAGEHEVVLRYHTPGLLPGAIITICGVAVTVVLARRRDAQAQGGRRLG